MPTPVRNLSRASSVEREALSRCAASCALPAALPHCHSGPVQDMRSAACRLGAMESPCTTCSRESIAIGRSENAALKSSIIVSSQLDRT
eukprot:6772767-Prymnesium_polylepis.1